jgi:hypothetical protein
MPHDIFISYASGDKIIANAICAKLEDRKVRCWIAPRDVQAGTEWGEAIVNAIGDCRGMVLVFSSRANESPSIRREVERAVSKGKFIIPFRIEDIQPTRSMEFCLCSTHWLDAFTPPLEKRIGELGSCVCRLLDDALRTEGGPPTAASPAAETDRPRTVKLRRWMAAALAFLLIGGAAMFAIDHPVQARFPDDERSQTPTPTHAPPSAQTQTAAHAESSQPQTTEVENQVKARMADVSKLMTWAARADRRHGVGARVDALRILWQEAEAARSKEDWPKALATYDALIRQGHQVEELDDKRQATLPAAQLAKELAEEARQNAAYAGAAEWASNACQKAEAAGRDAVAKWDEGALDDARQAWSDAAAQWNTAGVQAREAKAYRQARSDFETALAAVTIPKTPHLTEAPSLIGVGATRAFLREYGGDSWQKVAQLEASGEEGIANAEQGRKAYERAATLLTPTVQIAVETEKRSRLTAALLASRQAKMQSKWDVVMTSACQALAIDELNAEAMLLKEESLSKLKAPPVTQQTNAAPLISPPLTNDAPLEAKVKVDSRAYFTGESLNSRPQLTALQFKQHPNRFRKAGSDSGVSDALLRKTWVLYDPKEIMNLSSALERAHTLGGRLPTVAELSSLLTLKQQNGDWARINGELFPEHERTTLFWTDGTSGPASGGMLKRMVDLSDGSLRNTSADDQCGVLVIRNAE